MLPARPNLMRRLCRAASNCRLTPQLMFRLGTPRSSAACQAALSAKLTSWTPGRRHRSRRNWRVAGSVTLSSTSWCSPTRCARRAKTSFAHGCSQRCCGPSSSTVSCPGPTPASPDSSLTRTARRCRSRRATWSRRPACWSSTAQTRCATGRLQPSSEPTRPLTRRTRRKSKLVVD